MQTYHYLRLQSLVAVVLLVLVAACAPPPSAEPVAPDAPTPEGVAPAPTDDARPGGILRIGAERDVSDLDPHTTRFGWDINIMQNVYSGLVRAGEDMLPEPDLATDWEWTDPQTLEFTLRQGVMFHNGREVTAEDVKYSLERILDPDVPAGYASNIEAIASVEAPERYRVVIRLSRPDAALLANLSLPAMAIVPEEAVEPMPVGLKQNMVGSGPFMFREHIPDQRLVLVRNPDYFIPDQPLLDELHFIPLLDETARTSALRSGEVDYIEPVGTRDVRTLQNDPNIVVTGGPNLSFVAASLNTSKPPFDDVRVRQALAYAIDRNEFVEKAFDGLAEPLWGPPLIPPYWAGNTDEYYTHDPERARELLAEAGYPDGFTTNIRIGTGTGYHAPFATVLQSELRKVGIEVEIIAMDGAAANVDWREGNFDIYPIRWWGADFVDPDGALRPLFTCDGSYNNSRICHPPLDELVQDGLTVFDAEERKAVYRDAMQVLAEQQPWVFLVSFDRYQAMRSDVQDYTAYANASQYSLREVWLDR